MTIYIRKIDCRDHYIAHVKTSAMPYCSTFISFQGNITGSFALYDFAEMIKKHFKTKTITFELSDIDLDLHDKELIFTLFQ
jgi:hypothetical protein